MQVWENEIEFVCCFIINVSNELHKGTRSKYKVVSIQILQNHCELVSSLLTTTLISSCGTTCGNSSTESFSHQNCLVSYRCSTHGLLYISLFSPSSPSLSLLEKEKHLVLETSAWRRVLIACRSNR